MGTPSTNGLDPEQLRRLSIAVELVTNPAVIFVDEPDKNLDPQAARRIVACNHAVAKSGRTVISTLNHPVGRILGVFDRLLLLKRGGEMTYWGPVGGLACADAVVSISDSLVPVWAENSWVAVLKSASRDHV